MTTITFSLYDGIDRKKRNEYCVNITLHLFIFSLFTSSSSSRLKIIFKTFICQLDEGASKLRNYKLHFPKNSELHSLKPPLDLWQIPLLLVPSVDKVWWPNGISFDSENRFRRRWWNCGFQRQPASKRTTTTTTFGKWISGRGKWHSGERGHPQNNENANTECLGNVVNRFVNAIFPQTASSSSPQEYCKNRQAGISRYTWRVAWVEISIKKFAIRKYISRKCIFAY